MIGSQSKIPQIVYNSATVFGMRELSTLAAGLAVFLSSPSCFSPARVESLSCSAEGLCPTSQVCDYDNVCRDTYSVDGGNRNIDSGQVADSSTSTDADNSIDDASTISRFIVPTGPTLVTTQIGLSGFGEPIGSIGCGDGELMYGIQGRLEEGTSVSGFCEFQVRCGHLEITGESVVLHKDGQPVPLGLGVPGCSTMKTVDVDLDCPDNTVVCGWTGTRSSSLFVSRITSFVLQCTEISIQAALLSSQEVGPIGLPLGEGMDPQSAECANNAVGIGFRGKAQDLIESIELRCRRLEIVDTLNNP